MTTSDSSYVALEILDLQDTDEATKAALIQLLEIERDNLHKDRFTSRGDYRRIIADSSKIWTGGTN